MVFSSIIFLYLFLPAVLVLYFVVPAKAKNAVLFASSLFFYAWGERLLVLLFVASIAAGYVFALLINKFRGKGLSKFFLIFSLAVDLGLLAYFKYTDFFISSFNSVFGSQIPLLNVALPIGISFYLFQLLSYELDVYWGKVEAQKNFINFATYVSMFPQLIAGPIVRYSDIEKQLVSRTHSFEKISGGISRFIIGFGKKVLIANALGELTAAFRSSGDLSVAYHWLYAIAFMLQIYFDFSAYSDMAIGLGKIFGFDFNENFDHPYTSKSITEFWRRWHISLGSWFRDYVYIPLGGNRKGFARQMLNIFVVWMLTGLWHGAAWNFVLWGIFYAVLLMAEKLFLKKWLEKHSVFGHIYVLVAVLFGFVLFNATSLSRCVEDLKGMFAFGKMDFVSPEFLYNLKSYALVLVFAVLGAGGFCKKAVTGIKKLCVSEASKKVFAVAEIVFLGAILVLGTAYLVDGSFNPFLYFRF